MTAMALLAAGPAWGQQGPESPFGEGWRRIVPVPMPVLGEGDRYVAWVEGGWLQVRRETSGGTTEWHVVLARADGAAPPEIEAKEGTVRFALTYRDGRYFVREDSEVLNCRRERKSGPVAAWPAVPFSAGRRRPTGNGGNPAAPPMLRGWVGEGGFTVTSSPGLPEDRYDCVVRLSYKSKPIGTGHDGFGAGYSSMVGSPLRRAIWGRTWLIDDGELMVAERMLESMDPGPEVGVTAPPLAAKSLDGRPVSLEDYRGRYVLLDFWATWCGPCLEEVPNLKAAHEEFGKGGRLAVLGVSVDEGPEAPRKLVEARGIPWAQVHAEGAVAGPIAKRYGAFSIPRIYLIGPDGKVVARDLRGEKIKQAVAKALGASPGGQ
jgi:peroxiredoxin